MQIQLQLANRIVRGEARGNRYLICRIDGKNGARCNHVIGWTDDRAAAFGIMEALGAAPGATFVEIGTQTGTWARTRAWPKGAYRQAGTGYQNKIRPSTRRALGGAS